MRLYIADMNKNVRLGLQMVLHQEAGVQVVGTAAQAEGLLAQVEASQADVLLLDWQLPGASMTELISDLRALNPPPKIVVLSVRSEIEAPALSAGADAFVSKSAPPEELLEVVRSLKEGKVNSPR